MNTSTSQPRAMHNRNGDFEARVKARLAHYKRETLGVVRDGVWTRNGRSYPHILPADLSWLNVLPCCRDAFWAYFDGLGPGAIDLHEGFHHLNSSQALCFNLFFPFMRGGQARLCRLLPVLGCEPCGAVREASFEKVLWPEEGSAYDFYLALDDGRTVNVEVKYTESAFGTAVDDARHREKHASLYVPRLRGLVREELLTDRAFFLANYQIMRNLLPLAANPGNRAVFLVPEANVSLFAQARGIPEFLQPAHRHQVRVLALEPLVECLLFGRELVDSGLFTALDEFRAKYLDSDPEAAP